MSGGNSPVSATELGELDSFLDVIKTPRPRSTTGTKDSIEQTYKGVKLPDISQSGFQVAQRPSFNTALPPGQYRYSTDGGKT